MNKNTNTKTLQTLLRASIKKGTARSFYDDANNTDEKLLLMLQAKFCDINGVRMFRPIKPLVWKGFKIESYTCGYAYLGDPVYGLHITRIK